jgi:23S rRNA pseudouridine2457 synthase
LLKTLIILCFFLAAFLIALFLLWASAEVLYHEMSQLLLFNKPYGVLSQFSRTDTATPVLADYIDLPGIYPAGRLDKDSEGLLLLTDDGKVQHCISHPRHKLLKTYWAQVEGIPTQTAIDQLRAGVELKDGLTAPAKVRSIPEPAIWPRTPPVRYRAAIPTSWLELKISEGRNRQVRRMTAAVSFPTLRLIRYAVGTWTLNDLAPGQWRLIEIDRNEICHDTHTRPSPSARHRRRHHRKGRPVSHGRGNRQR